MTGSVVWAAVSICVIQIQWRNYGVEQMTDINKYANNTSSSSSSGSGSVMYICLFAHLLICYLSSPFHLNLCQTQKLRAGALFPSSNHDTIYIKWTNMYPYHELHALTKLTNIISQIYIYQTHACYVLRVRCAVSFDECESKHLKTTVFMTTTWGWSSFVVTQRIRIGCFLSPFWHFDIPTDSTASASCFSR